MNLPDPSPLSPAELSRLNLHRFVALDLETTGLDPRSCRALEFGAVLFEGGKEVAEFNELVAVEDVISPEITRITGITETDVIGKRSIEEVLPDFCAFVGDAPVIGQNVKFDLDFIQMERERMPHGYIPSWNIGPVYDTLTISQVFFSFPAKFRPLFPVS